MRIFSIVLLMILCATLSFAEIYKWVDENGRIHFSDKPQNEQANYYIPKTGTSSFEGAAVRESSDNAPIVVPTTKRRAKKKSDKELEKIEKA